MSQGERSRQLFRRACRLMPGGVSSPVRAFRSVGGEPLFIASAAGCRLTDADGREYLDYVGSWGPLILGHADPEVVAAICRATAKGTSYGAPCAEEVELAEVMVAAAPHVEMVRFVSSGTEAVMSAVRLARGATGRDDVVKFSGCYHGHADHLLVAAGSGLATFGTPSSAGVPASFAEHTIVLPLDDGNAFRALMRDRGDRIAAVLIEPVPANAGLLLQRPEFLRLLREECSRHGALLIFDEVISGFRVGPAGAAGHYGIAPDLATYGKVIGGGLPVGAYGGSRDLMDQLSPLGPVYQAGTLSGNPVAMAAGITTLRRLLGDGGAAFAELERRGARLQSGLQSALDDAATGWSVVRAGSILWLSLQDGPPPRRYEDIEPDVAARYARLHALLLERGVYLAPSAYEVMFVSLAHTDAAIDETIIAVRNALTATVD
ncbi:MAG TPA: glutamate-1-semialdehyde 2,1-aminomutase [Thermoanaerobaculales bacterium]|nr:glutamate-1-semialdehyde 2,1-aminomutase [Thermoanaerobaculales bacterium]HPA80486.1 glutamate-1-semialdehyde 2,1-aminomutase [Thermoanaerobaculales bacterium]HQL29296.1 glutamate-1-semialdehyde 2,1-aminomutase [Thermoanaerobaculales bacterium]HQN97195.1 glutamate-1-semialdehyde 2,1-aminomutase [Thermoanaerobaculales bacterium]